MSLGSSPAGASGRPRAWEALEPPPCRALEDEVAWTSEAN